MLFSVFLVVFVCLQRHIWYFPAFRCFAVLRLETLWIVVFMSSFLVCEWQWILIVPRSAVLFNASQITLPKLMEAETVNLSRHCYQHVQKEGMKYPTALFIRYTGNGQLLLWLLFSSKQNRIFLFTRQQDSSHCTIYLPQIQSVGQL